MSQMSQMSHISFLQLVKKCDMCPSKKCDMCDICHTFPAQVDNSHPEHEKFSLSPFFKKLLQITLICEKKARSIK